MHRAVAGRRRPVVTPAATNRRRPRDGFGPHASIARNGRAISRRARREVGMKRISVLLGIGFVVAAAAPVAAVGKPSDSFRDRINETFLDDPTTTDDDFCGVLPVTTHVESVQNGFVRLDKDGHPLFRASGRATVTWTNPATGLSVSNLISGQFRDIKVVENADGTTTFFSTN